MLDSRRCSATSGRRDRRSVARNRFCPSDSEIAHVRHRRGFFAAPRVRPMGLRSRAHRAPQGRDRVSRGDQPELRRERAGPPGPRLRHGHHATRNAEQRLHAEFLVTRVFADANESEDLLPRLARGSVREPRLGSRGALARGRRRPPVRGATGIGRSWTRESSTKSAARRCLSRGMGLAGRVWETGQACWVRSGESLVGGRAAAAARIGLKSACAFPIRGEDSDSSAPW